MKQLKMLVLASMVIFFTACGGGSSDNNLPKTEIIAPSYNYGLGIYDQNKTTYTYDENGSIATSTSTLKNDMSLVISYTGLEYANATFSEHSIKHTFTYDYEKNEVIVGPENSYESQIVCTFNDAGYYIECHSNILSAEYFYDESNRLERVSSVYEYIDYTSELVTIYNTDGKPVESIRSNTINKTNTTLFNDYYFAFYPRQGITQYTYYPNGFISTLVFLDSETNDKWTNTYDETKHARVLNTVQEYNDGTVKTYAYAYHTNGVLKKYTTRTENPDDSWGECVYTYDENFEMLNETCDSGTV